MLVKCEHSRESKLCFLTDRNTAAILILKPTPNAQVGVESGRVNRRVMNGGKLSLLLDAWWTRRKGRSYIARKQHARLAEIIRFARTHSAYYRELYRDLPENIDDVTRLPVTSKKELMTRFDQWITDPEITQETLHAFVDDPANVGEYFLGRYTALTTSGTSGRPGLFVWDTPTMCVMTALGFRMLTSWLSLSEVVSIILRGGRMSMVMGTGGHFASAVAAARLSKRRGKRMQALSVQVPIAELVDRLNQFQPVLLASYGSIARMLASEQEASRLHIRPVAIVISAEGLPWDEYGRIAKVFDTTIGNSYAATECPFLSYSCEQGWLHVNADWVILEAVDANYRPTTPGTQSHTVLLTNLANRVQPILRYDIGDSVVERADPCPCGNPLPAIRVQGRTSDLLTFANKKGKPVTIAPLALEADAVAGVELSQFVQTAKTSLRVRLHYTADADRERVWQSVRASIGRALAAHGLENVAIEQAEEPPEQSAGGKFRQVVPLEDGQ